MIGEVVTEPLSDHMEDIREYTLNRSIYGYMEEDYMRWHC